MGCSSARCDCYCPVHGVKNTVVMTSLVSVLSVVNSMCESSTFISVVNINCCRMYEQPKVKVPRDDVDPKYGNYRIIL